jgi:hypothetical protein
MTGHEFLVFSRDFLQDIIRRDADEDASVLRIELDQSTDDLERLVALVEVIKSKHDYLSSNQSPDTAQTVRFFDTESGKVITIPASVSDRLNLCDGKYSWAFEAEPPACTAGTTGAVVDFETTDGLLRPIPHNRLPTGMIADRRHGQTNSIGSMPATSLTAGWSPRSFRSSR